MNKGKTQWKIPLHYSKLTHQLSFFQNINLSLRWRHNGPDSESNHQPHGCLLNRLFRRRSRKTSKLRVTGLWVGNSPGPVNSPHKWPVTRKMFPFDDVIMISGPLYRRQVLHPRPQTSQGESVAELEHSCWLSLIQYVNLIQVVHPRSKTSQWESFVKLGILADYAETISHTLIIYRYSVK